MNYHIQGESWTEGGEAHSCLHIQVDEQVSPELRQALSAVLDYIGRPEDSSSSMQLAIDKARQNVQESFV